VADLFVPKTAARKFRPEHPDVTAEMWDRIDEAIEKYRSKRGSLILLLQEVQGIVGYLPKEVMDYIGEHMGVHPSQIYGVATFYAFFSLTPRGRHVIRVCLGTACYVKGGGNLFEHLEDELNLKDGGTTEDKRFTLEGVRCVGACALAPVVIIDGNVHREVTVSVIPDILKEYP